MSNCKICGGTTASFGYSRVIDKYLAEFRYCQKCGFIQADSPVWLDEAYSKAITDSDTGLVQRNIYYSKISYSLIRLVFQNKGKYVDYGGGYGLFVRLMRDQGCEYYWHDKYSPNLFAAGYEANLQGKYDLLTAFEVFEHLQNPREELESMLSISNSILFSTNLVPIPRPKLGDWWYYGLEHGQHISFFTRKSLQILAEDYSLNFFTKWDQLHFFTKRNLSPIFFKIAVSQRVANMVSSIPKKEHTLK